MGSLPKTQYAKSGDLHVAYQVTGSGPLDLVVVPGFVSHLEYQWEHPWSRRFCERLGSFSRLSYYALARRELARFRGREIDTAGDGFFAAFDGPARAIRCAEAVAAGVGPLGIEIRAGVHTGECEVIGDKMGGIAVHIGARVAGQARAGEVLVSGTVKDLVAGSGLAFEERGTHTLKGVPGEWRLFAVSPNL